MDVDENARVGVLVSSGEQYTAGSRTASAGDGDLVARSVELCLVERGGGVQCDDLGAQEVVTGCDVGGNLNVDWRVIQYRRFDFIKSFCLPTSSTAVLHVLDTPPIIVTLVCQYLVFIIEYMTQLTAPLFAGLQVLAKILNHGVEPSAVRASETLLK